MNRTLTPEAVAQKITVRAINFELLPSVQTAITEKASRLLRYSDRIEHVCVELENDTTRAENHQYVAKGKIDFGGPAILTSVTGRAAAPTLEYLIEQLEYQLRRQRPQRPLAASGRPQR